MPQTSKPLFSQATQTAVSNPQKSLSPQMEMALKQGQLDPRSLNPAEYDQRSANLITQMQGGQQTIPEAPPPSTVGAQLPPATLTAVQPQTPLASGAANVPPAQVPPTAIPAATSAAVGVQPQPQPQPPLSGGITPVPPVNEPAPPPPLDPVVEPMPKSQLLVAEASEPAPYTTAESPGSGITIGVPGIGDIEISPEWLEFSGGSSSPMLQRWQDNPQDIAAGIEEGKFQIKNGIFGWSDSYLDQYPDLRQSGTFGSLISTGEVPGPRGKYPDSGQKTPPELEGDRSVPDQPAPLERPDFKEDSPEMIKSWIFGSEAPQETLANYQEFLREYMEFKVIPSFDFGSREPKAVKELPPFMDEMLEAVPGLSEALNRYQETRGSENYFEFYTKLLDVKPENYEAGLNRFFPQWTGDSAKPVEIPKSQETLERVFDKETAERIMRLTGESGPKPSEAITDRFRADRTASGGYEAPSSLRPPRSAAAGTAYAKPGTMQVDANAGSANQPPKYQTPSRDQLNQNLRRRLELYK